MAVLAKYDWILALITIAFAFSAFGNGANDVANSYATSVAARTLTMVQVGFLSVCTEFIGAVALGSRVTNTIKNGIISIDRFENSPGVLMLAMACAETASAIWLMVATRLGMPVSTTQTIVGALIGVGFAAKSPVKWAWESGSVSQVAASWGIAPFISGAVSAAIFLSIKFSVLERKESLKWALRAIPFYFAFTAGMLALFIVVEAPTAPSLEQFGAGNAAGIILGVFFGVLAFSYVFFRPYFHRRLIKNDARLRFYHVFLGPTLWKENPWVPFPAPADGEVVIDYYESAHRQPLNKSLDPLAATMPPANEKSNAANDDEISRAKNGTTSDIPTDPETQAIPPPPVDRKKILDPYVRFLGPTAGLPIYYPQRLWSWTKFCVMQGVTRDCVSHSSAQLAATHAKAKVYDNKVEHLWTYAQVASAMMMSIAHGSNDVANAVGPWAAAYATFQSGYVNTTSTTPVFILVVAGLLLGLGFWVFGYHIIRSLGNKITQLSPTRGYSMELGAAITVLLASRLGLPVSTTQCLTGSTVGVALCNFSMGAVNWKQVAFIMSGWLLTLPVAGLISGCLMVMALNAPQF